MSSIDEAFLSDDAMFQHAPVRTVEGDSSLNGETFEDNDSGLSFDPHGELEFPLASQVPELDLKALRDQAEAALKDSRE
ncbi:MAG: hypothetical protein PHO20_01620 [Candidatus Peribacteraceae bacterium]|nr:hypothetical protein [Candidatus Peribacteraceae bacterium]MDD5739446.1 hypothetical protein [Candidatus Peribacteraceae bacterium]